jgi:hypothetical protein
MSMNYDRNMDIREHEVDSELVAREMVAKLRLIRRARQHLAAEVRPPVSPAPVRPPRDPAGRFHREPGRDGSADGDRSRALAT